MEIFKIKNFVNFLILLQEMSQVIHNFSSHILTEAEKSFLCRGLQFALPPKTFKSLPKHQNYQFKHVKMKP